MDNTQKPDDLSKHSSASNSTASQPAASGNPAGPVQGASSAAGTPDPAKPGTPAGTAPRRSGTSSAAEPDSQADDVNAASRISEKASNFKEKIQQTASKAADRLEEAVDHVQDSFDDDGYGHRRRRSSHFNSGVFVIALIIAALLILMITWSVSFTAMFFGALGALLSIALDHFLDHEEFSFNAGSSPRRQVNEETLAYGVVRAVIGMVCGAAAFCIVFGTIIPHWSQIAVVALFAALIFDRVFFPKARRQ